MYKVTGNGVDQLIPRRSRERGAAVHQDEAPEGSGWCESECACT